MKSENIGDVRGREKRRARREEGELRDTSQLDVSWHFKPEPRKVAVISSSLWKSRPPRSLSRPHPRFGPTLHLPLVLLCLRYETRGRFLCYLALVASAAWNPIHAETDFKIVAPDSARIAFFAIQYPRVEIHVTRWLSTYRAYIFLRMGK